MAKELYLYSPIYDYVAESLIAQMEENKGDDIVVRINTPGGRVLAGYGIPAKIKELQKTGTKIIAKVDGSAMSMGAQILIYFDEVHALDVSQFLLHRADMFVETEEDKAYLDAMNKDLESQMSKRIDSAKLKELKGITVKEMFASEKRVNVFLSAKEAKAVGLVDKIITLNPKEIEALNEKFYAVAAEDKPIVAAPVKIENPKFENMTLQKLKAEFPAIYAEALKEGVDKERDRVSALMEFVDVDAKAVKEMVEKGENLTQKKMAEFTRKALSAEALNVIEGEAAPGFKTAEQTAKEKTAKEKEADAFMASVDKSLNIDKKKIAA